MESGALITGWEEREVEKWVYLGASIAAYLLLNPRQLQEKVKRLPQEVEQYII